MSEIPPPEIILEKFLPFGLVENILSRLPVKSLKRFRAVEKSWCHLIDSEKFAKTHLQQSRASKSNLNLISGWNGFHWLSVESLEKMDSIKLEFEYNNKDVDAISNSCNGLVVVKREAEPPILFNPFSREYKVLPVCPQNFPAASSPLCKTTYGFGYDSKNDDYKVVQVMSYAIPPLFRLSEGWIYSLRSNSWRRTDGTHYDKADWPIHVNGALHTAIHSSRPGIGDIEKIMCFSVETEKSYEVAGPERIDMKGLVYVCLDGFVGCLALVCVYPSRVGVWVMEEYGVKESWVGLLSFRVGEGECIRPLTYIDRQDKILANHNCKRLVLIGVMKESFEHFKVPLGFFPFTSGLCVETLVSPHGWGKKNCSAEKRLNKKTKGMMVKKKKNNIVFFRRSFRLMDETRRIARLRNKKTKEMMVKKKIKG